MPDEKPRVSIATQLEQVHGLCGTAALDAAESEFIERMHGSFVRARNSMKFITAGQQAWITRIWMKHFA